MMKRKMKRTRKRIRKRMMMQMTKRIMRRMRKRMRDRIREGMRSVDGNVWPSSGIADPQVEVGRLATIRSRPSKAIACAIKTPFRAGSLPTFRSFRHIFVYSIRSIDTFTRTDIWRDVWCKSKRLYISAVHTTKWIGQYW